MLPLVALELISLDSENDDYFDRVFHLAGCDPAFATRLISYVNSAAIAPRQPITTLKEAFRRIGAKGAANLIITQAVGQAVEADRTVQNALWFHALAVACLMRRLASCAQDRVDADKAYLFGLLHDIGRFVLLIPPQPVLLLADEAPDSLSQLLNAEKSYCGVTHEELGYRTLNKWKLPREFAQALRYHHSPELEDISATDRPVIKLLYDADRIAALLSPHTDVRHALSDNEIVDALCGGLKAKYKIPTEELVFLVATALEEAHRMRDALGDGGNA